MNLSESVEFFGAYGTIPPTRDKTIIQRKLFFLGAVALVAFCLHGCAPKYYVLRSVDQKLEDRGITKERIADLEMENAALRAANSYLRDTRLTIDEREYLVKGRESILEMERMASKTAREVDLSTPYHGR